MGSKKKDYLLKLGYYSKWRRNKYILTYLVTKFVTVALLDNVLKHG